MSVWRKRCGSKVQMSFLNCPGSDGDSLSLSERCGSRPGRVMALPRCSGPLSVERPAGCPLTLPDRNTAPDPGQPAGDRLSVHRSGRPAAARFDTGRVDRAAVKLPYLEGHGPQTTICRGSGSCGRARGGRCGRGGKAREEERGWSTHAINSSSAAAGDKLIRFGQGLATQCSHCNRGLAFIDHCIRPSISRPSVESQQAQRPRELQGQGGPALVPPLSGHGAPVGSPLVCPMGAHHGQLGLYHSLHDYTEDNGENDDCWHTRCSGHNRRDQQTITDYLRSISTDLAESIL